MIFVSSISAMQPPHEQLFQAIRTSNVDEVRKIIEEEKIDVNAKNTKSETPLHVSATEYTNNDGLEIARLLIAKGADVNAEDDAEYTPLHLAVFDEVEDNKEIDELFAQLLVLNGANITTKITHDTSNKNIKTYLDKIKHYKDSPMKARVELLFSLLPEDTNTYIPLLFSEAINTITDKTQEKLNLKTTTLFELYKQIKGGKQPKTNLVQNIANALQIKESDIIFDKPFYQFLNRILMALSKSKSGKTMLPKLPEALNILKTKKAQKERLEEVQKRGFLKKILYNLGLTE